MSLLLIPIRINKGVHKGIYQSTYFIEYFMHDNFKYPRSKKIYQVLKKNLQDLIKKPKSFVSCNHMNCCLQNRTTHQFISFIYYSCQDKFKNSRIIKIHQVHQKLQAKQFLFIFFNLFSICNIFEFEVTQIFR